MSDKQSVNMPMLGNCPACGGQVSMEAYGCPHCGHPLVPRSIQQQDKRRAIGCLLVLIVVAILWVIGICTGKLRG